MPAERLIKKHAALMKRLEQHFLMRVKEGSDDYRYFPEPDLMDLYIDEDWKARIRAEIPELA